MEKLVQQLATMLQWGRGFSAAERVGSNLMRIIESVASMGPRLLSRGEFWPYTSSSRGAKRFNGAAASQPRRAGLVVSNGRAC